MRPVRFGPTLAVLALCAAPAASAQGVQYRSPAGVEYRALRDTGNVARAEQALAADPRNVDRFIALGVAQSGARQFREAIETFTKGLAVAPNNAVLLRWRGHRYLSVREFDKALADLTRGAQIDSTIYGIWYHLGVVRFARGEFGDAATAFRRAQSIAPDAGELAGATDWLWMSLSRAGRAADAKAMLDRRIDSLPVNNAYTQRLKLYRDVIAPEAVFTPADTADVQIATLAYGLGNWYLVRGDTVRARAAFQRSIASGGWPGFGFIVSEAELRRLSARAPQPAPQPASQPAPATARAFPSDSAIRAIITLRVEEKRSAGIVVGVLEADGRTRIIAVGDPGPGKLPLDGNSVFEIGSITKVFTSTLLAQMVLQGKVKLEDPVQKFLPSTAKVPARNGIDITLGSLSVQNSGLPRMPSNFRPADPNNPYADYSVAQMYEFLSGHTLRRDPGAQFEYSNLGVGLLGHALSLAAGKSYEQLQRDEIWTPLGMTRTSITLSPWMTEHLALGHDPNGKVVANWDLPTLAGAGAIRSTTIDMLKFIAANVNTQTGPLSKAMAMAHQPRASAGPGTNIGLNWIIRAAGADTIVWHNGGTAGYRTFAGFVPSRKVGIVVLTNTGGTGADDIGFHLLSPALPLAPKPVPPKVRTAIELRPEVLSRYVGVYQLSPQVTIDVKLRGDTLTAQLTGQGALRIWPEAETEFFYKEVDAQISFVRDALGNTTGLVLHQNGQNGAAMKVK